MIGGSTLFDLQGLLQQNKISSVELTKFFLDRIEGFEDKINAFISINENIIDEAKEADRQRKEFGEGKPLLGIPIAVKDLFNTRGLKTTAGSRALENYRSPYDATLVKKLKQAGALILGKCNLDEFAMGSTNESSYFGSCKNPWNLDYVPGGSSGGSAAAVAAQFCPASLGTDTGGSVRQPASFCNLVGLKPTYGRMSRYGIVAFASSLDQAGSFTRTIKDAALLLEILSGHDPLDSTSSKRASEKFVQNLNSELQGRKIGIIRNFLNDSVDSGYVVQIRSLLESLKKKGAEIIELDLPMLDYSVETYYLIATSEASSNLSRYDGVRYGYRAKCADHEIKSLEDFYSRNRGESFGEEVKRRIVLGTFALSSGFYDQYFTKAAKIRRRIKTQFTEAFEKCEVLLSPVTTSTAFKLGEKTAPLELYYNDVFTTGASLAGLPALSVPLGFSEIGLPWGIQLIADSFKEQALLNIGQAIESTNPLFQRNPYE